MYNIDFSFFPNACHVCKIYGSQADLLLCRTCRMISYCSKLHQICDWLEHKEICKAIQFLRAKIDIKDCSNLTPKEWYFVKRTFSTLIAQHLHRELTSNEFCMIIHRKECFICYKPSEPGKPLYRCRNCASISFCAEHKADTRHKKYCDSYKLAFRISITKNHFKDNSLLYLRDFPCMTLSYNMRNFLKTYVIPFYNKEANEISQIEIPWLLRHTDYISPILTTLFAMKKLNYSFNRQEFVIHRLAASNLQGYAEGKWELLFHLVPTLTLLRIVLVGAFVIPMEVYKLCKECEERNRTIRFEYFNIKHPFYMENTKYTRPDIVTIFNIDLRRTELHILGLPDDKIDEHLGIPLIETLVQLNCPYIFTSNSKKGLKNIKREINKALNKEVTYAYCGKNKFTSMIPLVIPWKNHVEYNNNFIIVYERLY